MNLLSTVILLALFLGVFFAPRRWALLAVAVGALYLTQGAQVRIGGINFFAIRLLTYACFARVVLRGELAVIRLGRLDRVFVLLYLFTTLVLLVREGETSALWIGRMLDAILTYFAFRSLIKTSEEFRVFLVSFAYLMVPYVCFLAVESVAKQNLFDYVGAGAEIWTRSEKVRCYGSFRHPSLLGSLGACFLPLFVALACDKETRVSGITGVIASAAIVGFSNSGGPISVMAVGIVGWLVWPARRKMQVFRRSLVAVIILLALIMKAPIWYLFARISSITGGTGWHRSYLMEVAFKHLNQWWLAGMRDKDTADWFPYTLPTTEGADITNQFLVFGRHAGLLAIVLLIILLCRAFSELGRALEATRGSGRRKEEVMLWGLGVTLASHISNWLGIAYFDQFFVLWLLQLAAITSLASVATTSEFMAQSVDVQSTQKEDEGVPDFAAKA